MKFKIAAVLSAALLAASCTTTDPYTGEQVPSYTGRGALIGAAAGAALGTLAGGDDRRNALIGAGIGALAGAGIGNYMDRQERAMREATRGSGVGVRREGNDLRLIMPGDVTFAVNSAEIEPRFYRALNDVAHVLNEYPASYVDVIGHTDSTGAREYNQRLSERRALSVANYLIAQGVMRERLYVVGMGPDSPIASNATADGRAQNRRVEMVVRPHTTS
ncbi:MAG: OmpA family protein [Maricaulaceae bacterium]|nr:OmpA family protein [Maricaulaceae bacterium]